MTPAHKHAKAPSLRAVEEDTSVRFPVHIRAARPTDAAAIARVHVESWRTTYRGILPDAFLAGLSYDQRAAMWTGILRDPTDQSCVYVAEGARGTVVGFAAGGPERTGDAVYTGEVYALYLLTAAQRSGLGRLLFVAVVGQLATAGRPAVLAWVVAANPACRFYEALEGQRVRVKQEAIGDVLLDEIAYGWTDTGSLLTSREHAPHPH